MAGSLETVLLAVACDGRRLGASEAELVVERARAGGHEDVLAALAAGRIPASVRRTLVARDRWRAGVRRALLARSDLRRGEATTLCEGLCAHELCEAAASARSPAVLEVLAEASPAGRRGGDELAEAIVSNRLAPAGLCVALLDEVGGTRRRRRAEALVRSGDDERLCGVLGAHGTGRWWLAVLSGSGTELGAASVLALVEACGGAAAVAVATADDAEVRDMWSSLLDALRCDVEQGAVVCSALQPAARRVGEVAGALAALAERCATLQADDVRLGMEASRRLAARAAVCHQPVEVDYITQVVASRPCVEWVIANAAVCNPAFSGPHLERVAGWVDAGRLGDALAEAGLERLCEVLVELPEHVVVDMSFGEWGIESVAARLSECGALAWCLPALCSRRDATAGLVGQLRVEDLGGRVRGSGALAAIDTLLCSDQERWEVFAGLADGFGGSVADLCELSEMIVRSRRA